jgi:serine/threonine-protein kinase ATR
MADTKVPIRGCVSGQQLENVRELCQQPDGSFDCDLIDGYDELG